MVEDLAGGVAEFLAAELFADPVARGVGGGLCNRIVSLFEVAVGNLVEDLSGALDAQSLVYGTARSSGGGVGSFADSSPTASRFAATEYAAE